MSERFLWIEYLKMTVRGLMLVGGLLGRVAGTRSRRIAGRQILTERGVRGFDISSSYGMSGWILAKSMEKILKGGTSCLANRLTPRPSRSLPPSAKGLSPRPDDLVGFGAEVHPVGILRLEGDLKRRRIPQINDVRAGMAGFNAAGIVEQIARQVVDVHGPVGGCGSRGDQVSVLPVSTSTSAGGAGDNPRLPRRAFPILMRGRFIDGLRIGRGGTVILSVRPSQRPESRFKSP